MKIQHDLAEKKVTPCVGWVGGWFLLRLVELINLQISIIDTTHTNSQYQAQQKVVAFFFVEQKLLEEAAFPT